MHNVILPSWKSNSHSLTVDDILCRNIVADAFDRLVAQGLTHHIGISGIGEADSVRDLIASR